MPKGPNMPDPNDFWNLSDLIPQRKRPQAMPAKYDTDAVDVVSMPPAIEQAPAREYALEKEHFVPPHTADDLKPAKAEAAYRPAGNLIHEVRIYPWKTQYAYYEQFCRHARLLTEREGTEVPFADFFSYMPQYSQMNRAQLAYYLWWRTNFRRGVCLEASYSYLLLYLYEIINQGDKITPKTGQENMLRLWLSYRDRHPRLDVLIREWLCDYSLLHRLPPPKLPRQLFRDLVTGCRLREFYVSATAEEEYYSEAILLFCSNYDYQKSKFYREDTAPLFDLILPGAAKVALTYLQEKNGENSPRHGGYSTVSRDAFSGAICSYRLKRRIEVDYSSFSHTHELRYVITDVLKYAENALRSVLGIKSRLSVYEISGELRTLLDAYLKEVLPDRPAKRAVVIEETPDYEKQYDLPAVPVSPEKAAEIEAASWQTTKRLIEAFENEPVFQEKNVENPIPFPTQIAEIVPINCPADQGKDELREEEDSIPASHPMTDVAGEDAFTAAVGELVGFFPAARLGDKAAQRAFAAEKGIMLDAIADRINTLAEEHFGDILLEDAGGFYTVIEDYIELLEERELL